MRLIRNIPSQNITSEVILCAISTELNRLEVNKVEITGNLLSFKNALFNEQGGNHLMALVNKGYFKVDIDQNRLIYNYSTIRMMLITLAMSEFFALISQTISIGIVAFGWLFGINWVITWIRHRLFMKRLLRRIIPRYNIHPTSTSQLDQ
jgi:hypothetical protein